MALIKLPITGFSLPGNTSGWTQTITDESNLYNDVDNGSCAVVHTESYKSGSQKCFTIKFDLSQITIPAGKTIRNMVVRLKVDGADAFLSTWFISINSSTTFLYSGAMLNKDFILTKDITNLIPDSWWGEIQCSADLNCIPGDTFDLNIYGGEIDIYYYGESQETLTLYPTSYTSTGNLNYVVNPKHSVAGADNETFTFFDSASQGGTYSHNHFYKSWLFNLIPTEEYLIESAKLIYKGNYIRNDAFSGVAKNFILRKDTSSSIINFSNVLDISSTPITKTANITVQDMQTFINAGSSANLTFYLNCNRYDSYNENIYLYGVEIELTLRKKVYYTVTPTLNGTGTITPSTPSEVLSGLNYHFEIYPTNNSDAVTAISNGIDITSQLVEKLPGEEPATTNLGSYSLISGTFSGSGASYFSRLVNKGFDAATTTSNYYASSSTTIAVFKYNMPITDISATSTITNCYLKVTGKCESTSNNNEYMCISLLAEDETVIIPEYNFKDSGSTSLSTQTLYATTLPTIEQLSGLYAKCRLGYYGGNICGATLFIEAEDPQGVHYYTYDFTVEENTSLVVNIGDTPVIINNLRIGESIPSKFYIGTIEVDAIYLGDTLVYRK